MAQKENPQEERNLSVYSLSEKLKHLMDYIEENEGEIPEWMDEELENLTERQIPQKLQGVGAVLRKLDAEQDFLKEEKKMLDARIKQAQHAQEKLKERVHLLLDRLGESKIKTSMGTFFLRETESPKVEDVELLPKELYTYVKKPVSQKEIKEFIKNKGEVNGVRLDKKVSVTYRKPTTQ